MSGRLHGPRGIGLRLDPRNYPEPDFIVFVRTKRLGEIKGPDVLLAVEVADSSLDCDLQIKPFVNAAFGVREYWVIDAAHRIVHRHDGVMPQGYGNIDRKGAADRRVPHHAPEEFAFVLDELEDL